MDGFVLWLVPTVEKFPRRPVRRAPSSRPADDTTIANAEGKPSSPQEVKELKIQDLIQRPRHAKTAEVPPGDGGGATVARARPEEHVNVEPGTAAQNTTAAVAFPAARRPLPHVPHHVRQARRVHAVRAHLARALTAAIKQRFVSIPAPCWRARRRSLPLRLRRPKPDAVPPPIVPVPPVADTNARYSPTVTS